MARDNYYGMIMAGGRGTRFWPRSRRRHPKQVLSVVGERTLIRQTADRLLPLLPPERLWVITNEYLVEEIRRQLPELPPRQILAEPAQRNTAPCNGLAARMLESLDPDAVIGVFPSDHVIGNQAAFTRLLLPAYEAAERGRIVVIGIQPRWPETGYGYLELPAGAAQSAAEPVPVLQFREKPDEATAQRYLEAGNFYWNAGMFFWRARVFLDELRAHLPATAALLEELPPFAAEEFETRLAAVYPRTENISVDYAVLEKAGNVVALPAADIDWNDIGSWRAAWELLPKDAAGNAARSELLARDASGNYVDAARKLVALIGVRDLVVVDTADALLVADRSRAQEVGDIVKLLEQQKREDLL